MDARQSSVRKAPKIYGLPETMAFGLARVCLLFVRFALPFSFRKSSLATSFSATALVALVTARTVINERPERCESDYSKSRP